MTPLQVIALGMAALAIYSAIKDKNPITTIKNVLQGKAPPAAGSWDPGLALGLGGEAIGDYNNKTQGMIWPTSSRRTTAQFGDKGSLWESTHDGLDIDGECGDNVWSPVAGAVKFAGWNGPYGTTVKIRAFNYEDAEVWLCHLQGIGAKIRPGVTVNPKTHIGSMGQTGNATGCHLHFMVVINGSPKDPGPYLGTGSGLGIGVG